MSKLLKQYIKNKAFEPKQLYTGSKFRKDEKDSTTAFMISKREISQKINKHIKKNESACPSDNFVSYPPQGKVSVTFAAKQFFQILLINNKYIHSKSDSDLELSPVLFESDPLIINI
jgi:hypothetical protein